MKTFFSLLRGTGIIRENLLDLFKFFHYFHPLLAKMIEKYFDEKFWIEAIKVTGEINLVINSYLSGCADEPDFPLIPGGAISTSDYN
jgi:hypothetical protein